MASSADEWVYQAPERWSTLGAQQLQSSPPEGLIALGFAAGNVVGCLELWWRHVGTSSYEKAALIRHDSFLTVVWLPSFADYMAFLARHGHIPTLAPS